MDVPTMLRHIFFGYATEATLVLRTAPTILDFQSIDRLSYHGWMGHFRSRRQVQRLYVTPQRLTMRLPSRSVMDLEVAENIVRWQSTSACDTDGQLELGIVLDISIHREVDRASLIPYSDSVGVSTASRRLRNSFFFPSLTLRLNIMSD